MNLSQFLGKVYRKKLNNQILFWIIIVLLSLIVSFVLEVTVFHIKQIFYPEETDMYSLIDKVEYYGVKDSRNEIGLQITANPASIEYILKREVYIDKFELNISSIGGGPIEYEVTSDTLYLARDVDIHPDFLYGEMDTVNINAKVSRIVINLYDDEGQVIRVNFGQVIYDKLINPIRFLITAVGLFLTFVVISYVLRVIAMKIQTLFLLLAVPFCIMLCIFIPPHYSWDEYAHLTRAVYLAEGDLTVNKRTKAYFPNNYNLLFEGSYRSLEDFYRFMDDFNVVDEDNSFAKPKHIETSAQTYLFIPYLIPALGVLLAHLFRLSAFYYMVFARLCNGAFYLILAYFGLKYYKGNKLLIFFLSLMPMMLFMCCSAGLNAMVLGPIIFAMGVITYYRKTKRKITTPLYILLLLLFSLATIARMTCGFLFFLIFLLPPQQFKNRFIRKFNIIIITALAVGMMAYVFYYSMNVSTFYSFKEYDINPSGQLTLIFTRPFTYLSRFWNITERLITPRLFIDFITTAYMGNIPEFYGLLVAIFLFIITLSANPKDLTLDSLYCRIVSILIVVLIYAATVTSMFVTTTPYNSGDIVGMQPRYILPLFFILLPCVQGKQFYLRTRYFYVHILTVILNLVLLIAILGLMVSRFYT